MKYLSFSLENYKGIKKFSINVDPNQPISLVGLNESGKTTILEGIDHIGKHCKQLSTNKFRQLLNNGELAKVRPKKLPGVFFSDEIKFACKVVCEEKVCEISFIYTLEKDKTAGYKVFFDKEELNFKDADVLEKINKFSEEMPEIIYYSDFTLEVPQEIFFHTNTYKKKQTPGMLASLERENKKSNNPEWQKILQDITDSLYSEDEKVLFQDDIVDYLDGDNTGDENSFRDKLTGFSRHINQKITKKWLQSLPKKSSLKEIEFVCNTMEKNANTREFAFKVISNDDATFDLSDRSKGCRWFFAFMLFTEFRKYRKQNTIFLLDEPASNLHSYVQEKVIHAINELCDEKTGSIVLYSTHSPYLLDIENVETMYLVENINASSEVREARIEVNLYTENTRASKKGEAKPISDYFQLNLQKVMKYFEKKNTPKKIGAIGKKFLENTRNIKNIADVIEFSKNL